MSGNGEDEAACARLRRCEEALLDAAVRRDRARAAAFLAEDFQEFGSTGRVWSREQVLELLATALVTYRTVRADPQSGRVSAALRSSLWTRECGDWRMRFHQGTKTP